MNSASAFSVRLQHRLVLLLLIICLVNGPNAIAQQPPLRTYKNELVKLTNPEPLLNDYPEFVQPVIEETRYVAPVLVDDADASLLSNGYRQPGLGDGIHGGTYQRGFQGDAVGKPCFQVYFAGKDFRSGRHKQ